MMLEIKVGIGKIIWIKYDRIDSIKIEKITDENEHEMTIYYSNNLYYKMRYYCYEDALKSAREIMNALNYIVKYSYKAVL